jgi:hypothetical protein
MKSAASSSGSHCGSNAGEVLDAHARPTLWTGGWLEASGRRQDDDSSRPSAHVLQKHPVDVLHLRQVLARPDQRDRAAVPSDGLSRGAVGMRMGATNSGSGRFAH